MKGIKAFSDLSRATGDCELAFQGFMRAWAEIDPEYADELTRHGRIIDLKSARLSARHSAKDAARETA